MAFLKQFLITSLLIGYSTLSFAITTYQTAPFRVSETPIMASNHNNFGFVQYNDLYFVQELNIKSAAIHLKLDSNSLLLHYTQQGGTQFGKQCINGFYTYLLSPHLKVGIGAKVRFWNQQKYELRYQITPNAGVFYKINHKNTFSVSIANKQGLHYNANGYLPNTFYFDWQRVLNKKLIVGVGMQQCVYKPSIVSLNANWFAVEELGINFTLQNNEYPFEFGIIYAFKSIVLNIQTNLHEVLGVSNQIGMVYQW